MSNIKYIGALKIKAGEHMLRERKTQQQGEYELVILEELVPQDHFLRKVDAAVDFSFIHDMYKNLYS